MTLAWALVGYFGLFDLGLGRALTKIVAERIGRGRTDGISTVVWTGVYLTIGLGIGAALLVGILTPRIVQTLLKVPAPLQAETQQAFLILAASIPLVTGHAGLRGVLEAWHRFDLTNAVRLPVGVLTFVAPLLVLPLSHRLPGVVASLACVRLLGFAIQLGLALRFVPALRRSLKPSSSEVSSLLRFGGWMTVSNLVGPLMVTLDRFVIGSLVSVSAVAYYATPYEVITKLWLVSGALVGVLFPTFASTVGRDETRTARLFHQGLKALVLALFPLCLLAVIFASEALTVWLGFEFASKSAIVLQVLALGVFVNSLATVPFALIQGGGRPDLTAKIHAIELPFYLGSLWLLVHGLGVVGAAIAWSARVIVDAAILFTVAERSFTRGDRWLRILIPALTAALLVAAILAGSASLLAKTIVAAVLLAAFYRVVESYLITGEDRLFIVHGLRSLRGHQRT